MELPDCHQKSLATPDCIVQNDSARGGATLRATALYRAEIGHICHFSFTRLLAGLSAPRVLRWIGFESPTETARDGAAEFRLKFPRKPSVASPSRVELTGGRC
jgi:hypothetical protein